MADGMTSVAPFGNEDLTLFPDDRTCRDGTGESRRTLSWIWITQPASADTHDGDNDNILRAEWAKSRARANRSKEEVMLIKEEMHRTLVFLAWRAKWWRERATNHRKDVAPEMVEALRAYTEEQACLQEALSTDFQKLWDSPLDASIPAPQSQDEQAHGSEGRPENTNNVDDSDEESDDEGDDEFDNEEEREGALLTRDMDDVTAHMDMDM